MKIKNSVINRIVKESLDKLIREYDEGEFTPISAPMSLKAFEKDDKQAIELQNKKNRLKYVLSKIGSDTFSSMHYVKSVFNDLNPMFTNQIENKKEKELAEIAHDLYTRCMELYEFINNAKTKI